MNLIETGRPQLILDEFRCKRNISRMASKAEKASVELRPHFKTHQSLEIGNWFRESGVSAITVSSVDMASYFASDGWNDITLAFPFYPGQLPALRSLEGNADLQLFIHDRSHLSLLSEHLSKRFNVIIEINPGYGRSGIHFENERDIDALIKECDKHELANFYGFYIHDGRTYQSRNRPEILKQINPVIVILQSLKKRFPASKCMMGDTPSCSIMNDFDSIDIITPGNFVFYDWMQVMIGSCTIDDVALYCQLPVAQITESGSKAILHGGAVHLSKDSILINGRQCFGQMIEYGKDENRILNDFIITSLSQEHGIAAGIPATGIKDSVLACPIHSCLTANLHRHYLTTTGNIIEKRILS